MYPSRRLAAVAALGVALALPASAQWERRIAPDGRNAAFLQVLATSDGGIVAAGYVAETTSALSKYDALVVKLDASGSIQWQRAYGGPGGDEHFRVITELPGGDLAAAGQTGSLGPRERDTWLVRLDGASGEFAWQAVLSIDSPTVLVNALAAGTTGEIIVGGHLEVPPSGFAGWLTRLDESGALLSSCSVNDLFQPRACMLSNGSAVFTGQLFTTGGVWIGLVDASGSLLSSSVLRSSTILPGAVRAVEAEGNDAVISFRTTYLSQVVPAWVRLDGTGAISAEGHLSVSGSLDGLDALADGMAFAGAIEQPGEGPLPALLRLDAAGVPVIQSWLDPRDAIARDVAATPGGYVVAGDGPMQTSYIRGGWLQSLNPAGSTGGCLMDHPLLFTILDPNLTLDPDPRGVIPLPVSMIATSGTGRVVGEGMSQACSTVACVVPTASILAVEDLPACAGAELTFRGGGEGAGPLTLEWDFTDDGTFIAEVTGPVVSHRFATAGAHVASLRVTDSCAASGAQQVTTSVPVRIRACPPAGDDRWALAIGGATDDESVGLVPTSDGGFVVGAQADDTAMGTQARLFKVRADGSVAWTTDLGSSGGDALTGLAPLPGGRVAALVDRNAVGSLATQPWLAVVDDATGTLLSQRRIEDAAEAVSTDGLAATAAGSLTWAAIGRRCAVVAMSDPDTIAWQAALDLGGLSFGDLAIARPTPDGGVFAAGSTSTRGWIARFDSAGALRWQRTIGDGSRLDQVHDVLPLADGCLVLGMTNTQGSGLGDALLMRMDAAGGVSWQVAIGDAHQQTPRRLRARSDGTFLIAGGTERPDAGEQAWLVAVNADGVPLWQREYGGPWRETAADVAETSDGGILLLARTHGVWRGGSSDTWVLRLDSVGLLAGSCDLVAQTSAVVTPTTIPVLPHSMTLETCSRVVAPDAVPATTTTLRVRQRCGTSLPPRPSQPELVSVTRTGSRILLRFTQEADAETYGVYEFAGGRLEGGSPVQRFCRVDASNPEFMDGGDGTATFALTPSRDLTSYLISASNWVAESALGNGTGGEINVPPSGWRCGANP